VAPLQGTPPDCNRVCRCAHNSDASSGASSSSCSPERRPLAPARFPPRSVRAVDERRRPYVMPASASKPSVARYEHGLELGNRLALEAGRCTRKRTQRLRQRTCGTRCRARFRRQNVQIDHGSRNSEWVMAFGKASMVKRLPSSSITHTCSRIRWSFRVGHDGAGTATRCRAGDQVEKLRFVEARFVHSGDAVCASGRSLGYLTSESRAPFDAHMRDGSLWARIPRGVSRWCREPLHR
jgi:hypothetical protein